MNIKAVMCDVDGTLLTNRAVVSKATREAIKKIREKGILFGLSTGREVKGCLDKLEEWGIKDMVDAIIGSGGAEVYDKALGIHKDNYPLAGEHIKEIMKHFEDLDINFAIPKDGVIYAPKDDHNIRAFSAGDQMPYSVVDFDEFLKTPQLKIMITCDPNYMDKVIERSKTFSSEHYRSAALITHSTLYEFMDPRVTKANGLKELMELHGWTMDELCTFGDADNDYDMTLHAGIGVVMANGSEKTKSAADHITDDCDHDGIANFINHYIL